jgi:hypothetical protein
MNFQRRWLLGLLAAAAATVVIPACSSSAPKDSCGTTHQMLDYNKSQTAAIGAKSDPEAGTQASTVDYQQWADQLKKYAGQISTPQTAGQHAQKAADLAGQTVTLVQQARNANSEPLEAQPPQWVQQYSDVQVQLNRELLALKDACPA